MSLSFNNPVDIANVGMSCIGANRLDANLGFNEVSVRAEACAFWYDKLRESELRRNWWSFAMKRVILRSLTPTTRIIQPALYSSVQTYFVNSIVTTADGMMWISLIPDNTGNAPNNSLAWDAYFGPATADAYDATQAYYPGELVYIAPGDGTYKVYMATGYTMAAAPNVIPAWSSVLSYTKDQVVAYNSRNYMSLIDLSVGQVPSASPAAWDITATYNVGASVGGSDGIIYISMTNGNIARDPATDGGATWRNSGVLTPWLDVTVSGIGTDAFTGLTVALATQAPAYPMGVGASRYGASRSAFRLPAGFLRRAPSDPKAGSVSFLGAPSGAAYDDWLFESGYIITRDTGPLMLRFVANITNVQQMDVLFCQGLGCRLGFEACEEITQSSEKKAVCTQEYGKFMGDARTINAIEAEEAIEPPEDDFISCRV